MATVVCVIERWSPIFREGLTSVLTKGSFNPVWSESSTEELPHEIAHAREGGLTLIGVREGGTVVEALTAAKVMVPNASIVVVGDSMKLEAVTTALASGATSFIDENVTEATLIKELELIAQGEPVISMIIVKRLLGLGSALASEDAAVPTPAADEPEPMLTEETAEPSPSLSDREAAILKALVQGTPNKTIADRMNITESTVKVHVKAILRKIRVKNRTQAAIWAMHHYALPPPNQRGNGKVVPGAAIPPRPSSPWRAPSPRSVSE